MVGNETGSFILSLGPLSDWILVAATVFMAAATFLLYLTTRNQKTITEKLGNLQLSFQNIYFYLQRYESELKEVIGPLYSVIQLYKNHDTEPYKDSYLSYNLRIGDLAKRSKFWSGIESSMYVCPIEIRETILKFMLLRSDDPNESTEPEVFKKARIELIEKIEERYNVLNDEMNSLFQSLSKNEKLN